MNNIKVTVTYDQPTTTKFDALMAEYEAVKKMADETVSYYKPLADVAEEAKFEAILEQLKPIEEYARQLASFSSNKQATIRTYISSEQRGSISGCGLNFEVYCNPQGICSIRWDKTPFTKEYFNECRDYFVSRGWNILGKWDEWGVYGALEENALRQLKSMIDRQYQRGQDQIDRLNNIQK